MTKAQRADVLLEAAKMWQNGHPAVINTLGVWAREYYDPHDTSSSFDWRCQTSSSFDCDWRCQERRDESSSAALSEAAGLGFDIVDAATGEPAEKVAVWCSQCNCPHAMIGHRRER